jgi:mannosyltransferase
MWALVLTALALGIRLSTLSLQSLWLDEAYTDHLVHLGFGAMLSEIPKSESTPPLYYILTWGWTHVFGSSEFALRTVSAVAGAATVPVVYALGIRLSGIRAGLIAGLLVAVSPLMVWYSQEARSYSLAALLASVSLLCLIVYVDSRRPRLLGAWVLAAALGLCTHYFVAFVILPELGWLIWKGPSRRAAWAGVAFVIGVALALLPLALAQRGTGHADYIAQGSLATRTLQVPKQLLLGYASPGQVWTTSFATVVVLAGAAWPLIQNRALISRSTLLVFASGVSCILVPLLLALVGVDFVNTRNVIPALPPLLVVAAVGFSSSTDSRHGEIAAGALIALFAIVVVLVETHAQYQRDDWRGAAHALGPPSRSRAIVITPPSGQLPLSIYQPHLSQVDRGTQVSEIDVVALSPHKLGAGLEPAPRPSSSFSVPPRFHLAASSYGGVYTVLRYTASKPVAVTAASLGTSRLDPGGYAALVQSPSR